jgi:hypothetical protein
MQPYFVYISFSIGYRAAAVVSCASECGTLRLSYVRTLGTLLGSRSSRAGGARRARPRKRKWPRALDPPECVQNWPVFRLSQCCALSQPNEGDVRAAAGGCTPCARGCLSRRDQRGRDRRRAGICCSSVHGGRVRVRARRGSRLSRPRPHPGGRQERLRLRPRTPDDQPRLAPPSRRGLLV